jgi:GH43 family beta-xylosidase
VWKKLTREEFDAAWKEAQIEIKSITEDEDNLKKFLVYLAETYFGSENNSPLFDPQSWARYSRPLDSMIGSSM